ncbi:MAG: RNA-binding protein [Bacteroidota bacterium]
MKLYVSNLNRLTSIDDIKAMFADIGDVAEVFLNEEPDPGKDTFTAWVEMEFEDEAEQAIEELSGEYVDGNSIRVMHESEYQEKQGDSSGSSSDLLEEEEEADAPSWQPIERKRPSRWKQ